MSVLKTTTTGKLLDKNLEKYGRITHQTGHSDRIRAKSMSHGEDPKHTASSIRGLNEFRTRDQMN